VVAFKTPVDCAPLVALPPLHPPDAVQLEAFVEFHVSVDASPLASVIGSALSVTVGAG